MWNFLFQNSPLLYLTQSFWRDEAFSVLLSSRSPLSFITHLTFEPPLYYVMLHFWLKLFGTSEVAARSFSLLGFILANVVVVFWAEKLFKKHWLSWFLPIFFFFNPQLMYYAFEVRAYGWYMFFAVASMYAYMEKKWKFYILATSLGLYTHTYMIIIPAIQALHYGIIHRKTLFTWANFFKDKVVQSILWIGLFSSPWLLKVFIDLPKLRQSWYFPVDVQLIKSVLGNIFVGYEGTPAGLWKFTAGLSLLLFASAFWAIRNANYRARNGYFFLQAFIPLTIILGISLFKPMFVNRYVMPVTIAEIFLVVFCLELIRNKIIQKALAVVALLFVIGFNFWYPNKHTKNDIRKTIFEIQALASPTDLLVVDSPLILFETLYYSNDPSRVFWYNPDNVAFPWYVGDVAFSKSQSIQELPPYPTRSFLIHEDTTFEVIYSTPMPATFKSKRL
jgi:mannosyltransferase